ncbi:MAG: hypothetical protein M3P49_03770 [Actinomycetota bacterium]|nr:hypothetical protein [Actinomycetota bacterium]
MTETDGNTAQAARAEAENTITTMPEQLTKRIAVNHQPSGGREWVAEIKGTHPKYRFEREFLLDDGRSWSGSGKTGTTYYEVEHGKVYEVNVPWGERYFFRLDEDGERERLSTSEVKAILDEATRTEEAEER